MTDIVVLPDPIPAIRSYLLSRPEVTAVTDRVSTVVSDNPTFPLVRVQVVTVATQVERRLDRVHVQLDCYGTSDQEASLLARTCRAALIDSANFQTAGVVLGGADGTATFPQPDEGYTPPAWRWLCTGNLYMHPNP